MTILLISYGDYDYDGRLRELYKVFSNAGDLYAITRGSAAQGNNHKLYYGGYAGFIKAAVAYGKSISNVDVLVLDNRKSVIPGLMLRMLIRPQAVIQDCRELYIRKEIKHFVGKVGCIVEKWGINRSDIIICANRHRAEAMKEIFRLKDTPIVYENLRRLEYSVDPLKTREKFSQYLIDGELRLISSSGCSVSRTNDVLVRNLDRVEQKCRLFLVGNNDEADVRAIEAIIEDKKLSNVVILGQLNQDELKCLISECHIGIVNYHQKDTNNRYCASGKVYEFLYEGIPVVTTTNPPLKHMCEQEKVGAADDAYYNAINEVAANYAYYQHNARSYAAEHPVEENNAILLQQILEKLKKLRG